MTYLKIFFILRSPRTTRKNRTSPNNGPIKNFFVKSKYFDITNKEITQIPKSESKKFSILCTFKSTCFRINPNGYFNVFWEITSDYFKNKLRLLSRPKSVHTCQMKPKPSRWDTPFKKTVLVSLWETLLWSLTHIHPQKVRRWTKNQNIWRLRPTTL